MAKINKSITINAPVEKVFAYMSDPTLLPGIWPSMVEVKDVKPSPSGGKDFAWVYKMAGVRFEGASETIEYEPNQSYTTQSTKGIQNKFVWKFFPEAGGTRVTVEIEYTIPVPVLGKLAESVIVKQNDQEAETLLANLKAKTEA